MRAYSRLPSFTAFPGSPVSSVTGLPKSFRPALSGLSRTDRVRAAAILASLTAHALLAAVLWPHLSHLRAPREFVTVDLRPGVTAAPAAPALPIAAPAPLPAALGAASEAPARPRPASVPPPAARADTPPEPGVSLQPPPASSAAPTPGIGGALSDCWGTRSPAAYVEACRRGEAPVDSVLNRIRTPEEVALERNLSALNEFTLRLHGEWMLDKFREVYAENFPAMH